MKLLALLEYIHNSKSFWIDLNSRKMIEFDGYHTAQLLKNPEKYDLSLDRIKDIDPNEDYDYPLIKEMFRKNWVSLRCGVGDKEDEVDVGSDKIENARKALALFSRNHLLNQARIDIIGSSSIILKDNLQIKMFINLGKIPLTK